MPANPIMGNDSRQDRLSEDALLGASTGATGPVGPTTWANGLMPPNTVAESVYHQLAGSNNNPLASGTIYMVPIYLPAGVTIGHLRFWTGGTAAVTPTHSWVGLFDNSRNMLACSADATNTALPATTKMNYAIANTAAGAASSFTTTYSGLYYVGICIVAATVPTVYGPSSQAFGSGPVSDVGSGGASSTGQTTPPAFPFQAAGITASSIPVYASVEI